MVEDVACVEPPASAETVEDGAEEVVGSEPAVVGGGSAREVSTEGSSPPQAAAVISNVSPITPTRSFPGSQDISTILLFGEHL